MRLARGDRDLAALCPYLAVGDTAQNASVLLAIALQTWVLRPFMITMFCYP